MFDLKGKVAFITGAGRGIGREIGLNLARAGAVVAVTDIADTVFETAKEAQKYRNESIAVKCDVSNLEEVTNAQKHVLDKLKKVDILINNAGIYPQKPFLQITADDWNKVMSINLFGTFYFTKAFVPGMVERRYGKIVNITSISWPAVVYPNLVHYSSSKAAISGFTKALALEMATLGINVNAVAPGAIDVGNMPVGEETLTQIVQAIPMGHMGKPIDVANLVAFLVSDEANYITGQTIIIDGGYSLP